MGVLLDKIPDPEEQGKKGRPAGSEGELFEAESLEGSSRVREACPGGIQQGPPRREQRS